MRINEIRKLYHVSEDPNLEYNPEHDLRAGQLGRAFYATSEPAVWRASLGERPYTYLVDTSPLVIAKETDYPDLRQLTSWAIRKGYMGMGPVVKPNGETVLDSDGKPLIRPNVTPMGEKLLWRDPMTGGGIQGLQNAYLLDHGFNAYEPEYSRDGHQVAIYDPSAVRLKKISKAR